MRKPVCISVAATFLSAMSGLAAAEPQPAAGSAMAPTSSAATVEGLLFDGRQLAGPYGTVPSAARQYVANAGRFAANPSEDATANAPAAPAEPTAPAANPTTTAPAAAPAGDQSQPAATVAPLDPQSAALQELLTTKIGQFIARSKDRADVLAFYEARKFAPLWVSGNAVTKKAQDAAQFLRGVAADGLDPADYPVPNLSDTATDALLRAELTLTNSVITFARHASVGRVAFSRVSGAVWYDQRAPKPSEVLSKLADTADARAALDGYNPQSPQYKALKAQLAKARAGTATASPRTAASEPAGKKAKGKKATSKTEAVAKSNVSVDTILANMERWRWMPHDIGGTFVMVNIPDYTLRVVQNGAVVWSTKIVAGKPGQHATPLLTETMKYITVNPTWNVPPSIIRNEYLPALARDPEALSRIGLKMGRNPDGSVRIFQPPGESNALGRIRFNFPNKFLVYQHDTPQKHLFAQTERAYSHGCMRVQNPDQYAEVLLRVSQPEDNYTAARIRSMYGNGERTINFKKPIPVYITYQTAFADDAGRLQTRRDVYGLDQQVLAVLKGDRNQADVPMARNYNSSSKPVASSSVREPRERSRGREAEATTDGTGSSWDRTSSWEGPRFLNPWQPVGRSSSW